MVTFDVRRDPTLDEEVWLAQTGRGLAVRVVPTSRFREVAAAVTVRYGSTDLGFVGPDGAHRSPEGVAHYLEHKLFEAEDLHTFDRFAQRGAQVNAYTSFTRTSYWFAATSAYEDNLRDLLRLVGEPHITPDNVDKERGIIAQEIKTYEDAPNYRAFFDLLRCLYREHPVRHPVAGTVASIQDITDEELLRCHAAFYRTGNAVLAVAGAVDADLVVQLAEQCALAPGEPVAPECPPDLGPPHQPRSGRAMQVARPRVLLGVKDATLLTDGEARGRRDLLTRILLDLMAGPASAAREDLVQRGVADDSLSSSYMSERTFGFAVAGGESEDPAELERELRALLTRPVDVGEADLERVRRKVLGQYVRSFEAARSVAFAQAEQAAAGIMPFRLLAWLDGVTAEALRARQTELFGRGEVAVATVAPTL
ncbi:MAG: pitrilysin family protein [Planctomycetota bacterium]